MYTDDEEVADEVAAEDTPDWVKEGTEDDDIEIAGEDISQAEASGGQDWIEPAKDVVFEITKAYMNPYTPKNNSDWKTRSLKLYLKVGEKGVDGKGKYAGKVFFPNSRGNIGGFLVAVNRDSAEYDWTKNAQGKNSVWYAPKTGGAFAGYKEVLEALGFPTNPTPMNNKAFRDSLVGRKVMANIDKKHRQAQDSSGKYVDIADEFENELSKFRPVKIAAAPKTEEAAA